jgi:hypothetical protein
LLGVHFSTPRIDHRRDEAPQQYTGAPH